MKIFQILIEVVPVLLMIILILFVRNDYFLSLIFIVIILISFYIKYEKKDFLFLVLGFFVMMISEIIFISTDVETFNRNSLFGIMPLWLPVLWAYAFVTIKRAINILK